MSDRLRAATILVAALGLGIAGYLAVVHYAGAAPVCALAHGCATVQASPYARLAGVPVALLGVIGYVGILAALALGGFAFSAWLTYVEVVRLDAICVWCVGSALCMTLLAGLTVARALRSPAAV